MSIIALCIVSMTELAVAKPDITYQWVLDNPEDFNDMLHNFGMDMKQPIELQEDIQHKNRLNKVVVSSRWVGYERTDFEWIHSGYASREAKDKASGSKLLEDIYRAKGLAE